ncbi:MAG: hypothetical protein KAR33_04120 [Candidatus Thorarchaeota archaeon]|nr:hypothetical protein [Candidatus Thorarchaeota archaeon]
MSYGLKDIEVTGLISKVLNRYVVITKEGVEYELSAIMPWEAVSPDFDSGQFAKELGHTMIASGKTDGSTIWGATLSKP